jgi:anti-sigma-K factor RskA
MHPSPDILALLALGETAGTPAERDHVDSCPQCRNEVAELARAVAAGRSSGGESSGLMTPPDRVWQAIHAELGFGSAGSAARLADISPEGATLTALPRSAPVESNGAVPEAPEPEKVGVTESGTGRQPPTSAAGDGLRSPSPGRGRRLAALALAAVVALVAGVGLGLGLDRILGPRQTVLWTADLQALPAFSGSAGRAVVEQDALGNKTLVIEVSSPPRVEGSQEVWLIDRDVKQMRSLGYLTPNSNRFGIPADLDPRQFPVVDVSAEPPNDADTRHSGTSIVRGTLNV